jgi:23S rRNA (cytidine1920-2'-O)/16S rRNA (cytidine1409-2'-O)-methyltransferase
MTKMRADRLLVSLGLAESRARAQAAIKAGFVTANGVAVRRASQMLAKDAELRAKPAHPYVSRGGVKLAAALDRFGIDPSGKVCLDLGASTGGFTEVLLLRGAQRVFAVDVGRDQLHPALRGRHEIVLLQNTDARALDRKLVPEPIDLLTVDISFISMKLILPSSLKLAASRANLIALIKPQFEAGRKLVRKGIVRNADVQRDVCIDIAKFIEKLGWRVSGIMESPIKGGEGNREFLIGAVRV